MPQNIKSCISVPCFKCNLHKYMSEDNLSSNLDDLFESHICLKMRELYPCMPMKEILMFLHICRNCETALISCLIVLIIFVCGIVMFICVCSIAMTGC